MGNSLYLHRLAQCHYKSLLALRCDVRLIVDAANPIDFGHFMFPCDDRFFLDWFVHENHVDDLEWCFAIIELSICVQAVP